MLKKDRLLPLNLQFFAETGGDAGAGGENSGDHPNGGAAGENDPVQEGGDTGGQQKDANALMAQIDQLKADMAKQKAALDEATREAGKYRKELRARQTQEEIDAENKKEEQERAAARLAELEKEVARTRSAKAVMARLGVDEDEAGKISECLAGCEDVENALLLIRKAWDAREKALRLEFGKIPGPGTGGGNEENAEENAAIEMAKRLGRDRAAADKSVTEGLKGYIR